MKGNPELCDLECKQTYLLLHKEHLLVLRVDLLIMNQLEREGMNVQPREMHKGHLSNDLVMSLIRRSLMILPFVLEAS